MKINFDHLCLQKVQKNIPMRKGTKIDLQIESPIYQKIVKSVSPNNFQSELHQIRNLITIPDSINKFLHKEIENQIIQQQQNDFQPVHFQSTYITNKVQEYQKQMMYTQKSVKNNQKKNKKPNPQYKFKKPQCSKLLKRQTIKQIDQQKQTTHHPFLYPNKITDKVTKNRKVYPYSKNGSSNIFNIYEHLYSQTVKRQMKKQLKNSMKEVIKRQKPTKNHKLKNYTSIYNRLDQILENRNKKYDPHISKDLTSGRQLFKPNLDISKNSYRQFVQSLSKEKQKYFPSISIQKDNPQKKPSLISQTSRNLNQNTKPEKQLNILDQKVINYFIDIFYPENENISEIYALKKLNKQDFAILYPFIHEIEEIQNQINDQETTVSSQRTNLKQKEPQLIDKIIFKNKFQKFYKNLNLYDRDILRKKIKTCRYVDKKEKLVFSHRPSINIRSSSLDNLAKGHSKHIYYV